VAVDIRPVEEAVPPPVPPHAYDRPAPPVYSR